MKREQKQGYVSFLDILRTIISGTIFIAAILFMLWIVSIKILPNPDINMDEFIAEFIKRAVVTVILVSSGVDAAYNLGYLIMLGFGSIAYNRGSLSRSVAQRYIETKNNIQTATDIINKYGMNIEFEEIIDFVNYESRTNKFERLIKEAEYKKIGEIQKRKNRKNLNVSAKLREELHIIKTHNLFISKQRLAITKFDRLEYLTYDNKLTEIYGEPRYKLVYSSDIFESKIEKNNIFILALFYGLWKIFKERVYPIISPLIFVGLTTYYIIYFGTNPNNQALLLAVGITTIISVLWAFIMEITVRFKRDNLEPLASTHYIMRKFISKNKKKISVLEKGEKTVEEFMIEEEYYLEKLKKELSIKNESSIRSTFEDEALSKVKKELKQIVLDIDK